VPSRRLPTNSIIGRERMTTRPPRIFHYEPPRTGGRSIGEVQAQIICMIPTCNTPFGRLQLRRASQSASRRTSFPTMQNQRGKALSRFA
jgi:hypothetical protein